jgi:hypothetical protein
MRSTPVPARRDVVAQRIGLVGAPRRQRGTVCQARDQFDPSLMFRRARDYCERAYDALYILSPHSGIVRAQQVIGPDAVPFARLDSEQRERWAVQVADELRALCEGSAEPPTFYLFASQRMARALKREAPFATIERPLGGMKVAEQRRWFEQRLRLTPRVRLGGQ